MADVEVTLNSSSDSVKYQGYVLDSCNNNAHVADGSWSPSSATGMTVSASGATITITHNNTSTSDASSTFTWTSSKVSGCSKTLKVTAKGKTVTYEWTISTDGGYKWTTSSGYSTTITVDNNFSGGEFVSVAYCPKNSVMDNCAESFTVRNGSNILSRPWGLSDLKNSGNNCASFVTPSGLVTDLKNSSEGSYTISGDIISSLGSNFPINVTYKVSKPKTTVRCQINLYCGLEYTSTYCDNSVSGTDADFEVKCNNYTKLLWTGSYAAMSEGLNTKVDLGNINVEDTNITPLSGSVTVSLPHQFITKTSSITISFGGDASGSKTLYGAIHNCQNNTQFDYYYVYTSGLSATGSFSNASTSIKISVNIG